MQLLIIKRRGAGSQFLLSNYPATAHTPGMGAKAGAPHAPIPNGGFKYQVPWSPLHPGAPYTG